SITRISNLKCAIAKSTRQARGKVSDTVTTERLEKVYADLCGPLKPASYKNYSSVIKFTDHHTRLKKVHFLRRKSEAPQTLSQYMNDIGRPAHLNSQVLRTDNGGEFVSSTYQDPCRQYLIQREYSAHTP
ncbi:unnamed protein product, partial [Discosporangium mesarthrocarpum]